MIATGLTLTACGSKTGEVQATSQAAVKPLAVARDQILESGLVKRHLAARQRLDLRSDDLPAVHVVSELREAGRGDEPDPAGTDDADRLPIGGQSGLVDRAMSIICRSLRFSGSVFEIQ